MVSHTEVSHVVCVSKQEHRTQHRTQHRNALRELLMMTGDRSTPPMSATRSARQTCIPPRKVLGVRVRVRACVCVRVCVSGNG